ncbi:54S ribosomal protein L3 [Entomophthora muscae]|uniref:54S ribosomal protein L3 n=1 Tax=Entomophthora muscae TaxID=34485 RepID=A0ACC2TFJ7_9FUNG|nr:54S ribosomal protein L3 [Entomophthora muscae]
MRRDCTEERNDLSLGQYGQSASMHSPSGEYLSKAEPQKRTKARLSFSLKAEKFLFLLEDCQVTHLKTPEKDGYLALQIGAANVAQRKITKNLVGHFASNGVDPKRHLTEFKVSEDGVLPIGELFDFFWLAVAESLSLISLPYLIHCCESFNVGY